MTALDPMTPAAAVVEKVRRETGDTYTLEIRGDGGQELPRFEPGQFSMLYAFGIGEAPISLSSDAGNPERLSFTIRAVGPVTRSLVASRPGDVLGLRGPFGRGWPVAEAKGRDLLLVAGGIGLAPLRSVVYHVLAHRRDYGRSVLVYGARTPQDLLYTREIKRWQRRASFDALLTVDRADLDWTGSVGVVTRLFSRVEQDPTTTVVMSCGPEVMMRAAARELERRGFAGDDLYVSLERNMACAIGVCGHCQFGPEFICKDGPVLPYTRLRRWLGIHEL